MVLPTPTLLERFQGCLVGLAIGDALGYPVEFLNRTEIRAQLGGDVTDFVPHTDGATGLYSDDTQMTLAVAAALLLADLDQLDDIMGHVRREFCTWARSAENVRSPGQTCMDGIRKLEQGIHWFASGDPYSKGNGAAMRAAPIGLLFTGRQERLIEVSRAVAICTHAHPTGISSAIAAAAAVAYAVAGGAPDGFLRHLKATLCTTRGEESYQEVVNHDPLHEQLQRLDDVATALGQDPERAFDITGAGWVGEEAVAGALYAYLRSPGDFATTVLCAANAGQTDENARGHGRCDSDSIACIAGGISGAALGIAALPRHWVEGVENSKHLLAIGAALWRKAAR